MSGLHWQPGYVYPPVFAPPHLAVRPVDLAVYMAVAFVVAAVTMRRPALGVGALILCVPFADAHYVGATSLTVSKAALAGFFVALMWQRPSFAFLADRRVRLLILGFAAVLGSIVLSGIGARYPDAVARETAKWLEYAATFAAALVAFANDPDDRPIWRALVAIAYVEAALCVFQLLFGASSGLFVHGQPVPRVSASLEGPNQFSGWLDLLIPVLLARTLLHRDAWLVGALAASCLAEAATLSRSGIVAALVGAGVVLLVSRPTRRLWMRYVLGGAALVGILVVFGASLGLEARFATVADVQRADRLGTRAILWSSALQLWHTSPVTGVGAGNFERELGMVGHPDVHTHANSLYLQALAETGLVGLAAVLLLVYGSLAVPARAFSRRPLVTGVFGANVALALHQVFDYLWFFPKVGAFWALLLGIGIVEVLAARDDVDAFGESA